MEKKLKKMGLTRETLHTLDAYRLADAQGAGTLTTRTTSGPTSEGTGACSICGIEH